MNPILMQLYSTNTPNGIKVAAMLEEVGLLESGKGNDFNYEPHTIDLREGETKSDWFKRISPTGKIPALIDNGTKLFESGSILLYLAEKYDCFSLMKLKNVRIQSVGFSGVPLCSVLRLSLQASFTSTALKICHATSRNDTSERQRVFCRFLSHS